MGVVVRDDGWRIPDWLWAELEPLLPERPAIRWGVITRVCPTGTR